MMKKLGLAALMIVLSVTVAGCHFGKNKTIAPKKETAAEFVNKPTLDSLDIRVTNLEHRLDAAKAARAKAAVKPAGQPYPYYVK